MVGKSVPSKSKSTNLPETSSQQDIVSFLKSAKSADPNKAGRLVFALDATMSRQPTWDMAMSIQAGMFDAVGQVGGLSVQLCYFRGFGECRSSRWVLNANALRDLMTGIECRGGKTQIAKVLSHLKKENRKAKVDAMVFIGDCVEEDVDRLCHLSGEIALHGTRCFFFQEGNDVIAQQAFKEMARLSNGAYFKLGPNSAAQLSDLLAAIAVYARGGLKALEQGKGGACQKLLGELGPKAR